MLIQIESTYKWVTYIFFIIWTLRSLSKVACHSLGVGPVLTWEDASLGGFSEPRGISWDMLTKNKDSV